MRLRPGEQFCLFAGDGREWSAEVDAVPGGAVHARVIEVVRQEPAPALSLELWCALVRSNRFDLAVEKCTEAGVDVIRPLLTDHGARGDQPSASRFERWRRIAVEASEQSGRLFVPVVAEPLTLRDALARARHPVVVAGMAGQSWPSLVPMLPDAGPLALAVGPEGGWSDGELATARASGALLARIGPNILRTETAAIALVILARTGT
jgi:16S rRNA (uracil1498-N3)-methyltransferase